MGKSKKEGFAMAGLRTYHVFISHSWKYPDPYETVKKWLDDASYFYWSDYSVPFYDPLDANSVRELKTKISTQIAKCSCVVILAGMYVNYSRWIDFEIDRAVEMGKPIIGVRPWGQERVPKKVADNSDVMVGWNSSSVVQAIRDYSV